MKNIHHINEDPTSRDRIARIVSAMESLFQVPEPGLTMHRTCRSTVAKYAAVAAIMASEDCGRETAEKLLGVETRDDRQPLCFAQAHEFAGMVTVGRIWEAVEILTGATKDDVMTTTRRPNVVAARFISRVLLDKMVGMSGGEIGVEAGNRWGYSKAPTQFVASKTVNAVCAQALRTAGERSGE